MGMVHTEEYDVCSLVNEGYGLLLYLVPYLVCWLYTKYIEYYCTYSLYLPNK